MKYEGDVNYATDPYGAPPPQGRSKRGLFALGFAVVGIVAFAGTIIVSYKGGDRLSSDGPPLLTADPAPTKSRPEQPGGMEVPHQDKLVYQRLNERANSNGGGHPNVERLLPPPEAPLPRPVVTPQMPALPPMPAAPTVAQLPPPPPGATSTVPRDGAEAPPAVAPLAQAPAAGAPAKPGAAPPQAVKLPAPQPAAGQPAAKPPAPAQQQAALPPPKAATPPAQQAAPAAVAKLPAPPPAPAAVQPAPQAAKPAAAPAVTGGSGSWRIQLASVRSEGEAASEWKRIAGRYPDALGGLSFQVAKVDLGEKGIFYRVQGAGADETRAKSICAQLRAQNTGCVVVRP